MNLLLAGMLAGQPMIALGAEPLASSYHMTAEACLEQKYECACFGPKALQHLSNGLLELKVCQQALIQERAFTERHLEYMPPVTKLYWWQSPGAFGGGIVTGFLLGVIIGTQGRVLQLGK